MLEQEKIKFEETAVCERGLKKKLDLSHLLIGVNTLNDDINIALRQREASQDLLAALKEELGAK